MKLYLGFRGSATFLMAAWLTLNAAPVFAGEPSASEQLWLEMINRFRSDPVAELDVLTNYTTLGGTGFDDPASSDPEVASSLDFFNVDPETLRGQFDVLDPAPPLAWSPALHESATSYSELIIAEDEQSHTLDGKSLIQRFEDGGYAFTGGGSAGENIFAFARNVFHGHAGFVLDWGSGTDGIQDPPGHRDNLLSHTFDEIGIGMVTVTDPTLSVGPFAATQHLATANVTGPFLTGVSYRDLNSDAFYSIGEGVGDLTINIFDADSGSLVDSTQTFTSGGYVIELPGNALYDVQFLGPAIDEMFYDIQIDDENVKLDAVVAIPEPTTLVLLGALTLGVLTRRRSPHPQQ